MTTRNRCHFVGIDTPPDDAAKRVTFCREAVLEEGTVMIGRALKQPADLTAPFLPDIATSVRTVADPVTGQTVTFSGAALAAWITAEYDARNTADVAGVEPPAGGDTVPASPLPEAVP